MNGHMRYYQEYFDIQLGSGKGEEEIAGEFTNIKIQSKGKRTGSMAATTELTTPTKATAPNRTSAE